MPKTDRHHDLKHSIKIILKHGNNDSFDKCQYAVSPPFFVLVHQGESQGTV
jgi:hypothetical protein